MIRGFSKFDPWPVQSPFKPESFESQVRQAAQKINQTVEVINQWCTLMNIFEFHGWDEPLTGDLHLVVKASKLRVADHVGEAVERLP